MPVECCTAQEQANLYQAYTTLVQLVQTLTNQHNALFADLNEISGLLGEAIAERDTAYLLWQACTVNLCAPSFAADADSPATPSPETYSDGGELAQVQAVIGKVAAAIKRLEERHPAIAAVPSQST